MTPREFSREQEAYEKRAQFDRERDVVLAWHTAVFTRTERMPSLETVLARVRTGVTSRQTYEQMKATLELISHMTGRPLMETKH